MDFIFRLLRGQRPTAVRADASKADASTRSISDSQARWIITDLKIVGGEHGNNGAYHRADVIQ